MQQPVVKRTIRFWLVLIFFILLLSFLILSFFARTFVEPLLRKRLHTLIIQGSDSLYSYKLGRLHASFWGRSVEVENLQIDTDSSRYRQLKARNQLPSVTLQLNLIKGEIKGINILQLMFSKKVSIGEIFSKDANIRLIRHLENRTLVAQEDEMPLWKSIQPGIKGIHIDKINLDGVKLLYRYADTAQSLKLQFDTCYAIFKDIRIDSIGASDTGRVGFARHISMRFHDLKFRSADSTTKLKAKLIAYSSESRTLQLEAFKMQPTLKEKKDFYTAFPMQKSMNVLEFEKAALTNFRLDLFVKQNIISADSGLLFQPTYSIYLDKTMRPVYSNKTGNYPHQKLLNATSLIRIKSIAIKEGSLRYTEKAAQTGLEGTVAFDQLSVAIDNVTNDQFWIQAKPLCMAKARGRVLGSTLAADFQFHLDSANGAFRVDGKVGNMKAHQLNTVAIPLANTQLTSFDMDELGFSIYGNDMGTKAQVRVRYNNLAVVLRKTDKKTGTISTNKFLTKVINKYTLQQHNPVPGGPERVATDVTWFRPTSQAFFGLIWKTIFAGMKQVMLRGGS